MEKFIKEVIISRKITLFIVILLSLFGIYRYTTLPKQESPDISAPYAIVTVIYPGASVEDVKELVTDKIEAVAKGLEDYLNCYSDSKNSLSIVTIKLKAGIDVEANWQALRDELSILQRALPNECLPIKVATDLDKTAGMIIGLYGEDYSYDELSDYGSIMKDELSKIKGIASFEVTGAPQRQIHIDVDMIKLNKYQLSLSDLVNIIVAENSRIPAGHIQDEQGKIAVSTDNSYKSLEEIKETPIYVSEETGGILKLRDFATVTNGYEDNQYKVKHLGKNTVLLTGYFNKNENILPIGEKVQDKVSKMKSQLPESLGVEYILFQPEDISRSLKSFLISLVIGIGIVIFVVVIGMGGRNALIVSTAIPFSILLTLMTMGLFKIKIHQVSISALIIALGMLVDNAIVVIDSIQVKIDKDMDRLRACVDGVKEVAIPIFTSTLTTVGAFSVLLMLGSLAGEFILSVPQVIIISLTASYLVALLVTPTMAYILLKPMKTKQRENYLRMTFEWALKKALRQPVIPFLLSCTVLLSGYSIFHLVNLEFFPTADHNIIYMDIQSEALGDIKKTEQLMGEVTALLDGEQDVITYTSSVGGALPKFYYSMFVYPRSNEIGQIMFRVDLSKTEQYESTQKFAQHLQEKIDETIVGGDVKVKLLEQAVPVGAPIQLIVTGPSFEGVEQRANEIMDIMRNTEGITKVKSDYQPSIYQYHVDINETKMPYYGLMKIDVQKEIMLALRGAHASTLLKGGKVYPIIIRSNTTDVESLLNVGIKSSITGHKILLKEVADIKLRAEAANIKGYSGETSISLYAQVLDGYSSNEVDKALEMRVLGLPRQGVNIYFRGERNSIRENFQHLFLAAGFAAIMIYLILLLQFRSFQQPFIVLSTVPFACVGSLAGLAITRQNLSFTALLGMVSLIGIVVNNAIVLVDFINRQLSTGRMVEEACFDAMKIRFRPIMLSSFTTIMGLLPLAFSKSELFVPLSVSIIFGLLCSTILTLIFVPTLYNWIFVPKNRINL